MMEHKRETTIVSYTIVVPIFFQYPNFQYYRVRAPLAMLSQDASRPRFTLIGQSAQLSEWGRRFAGSKMETATILGYIGAI